MNKETSIIFPGMRGDWRTERRATGSPRNNILLPIVRVGRDVGGTIIKGNPHIPLKVHYPNST